MAATVGRLLKTSARLAAGGLSRTANCTALQRGGFSTSTARFAAAVTHPAPAFKGTAVHNGEFKEMSLDDFKGKYLVLFFYPLDFTFVCPTEIIAFSDKANEFHDVNCEVVGVSVDSHFSHLAWMNTPRKAGGLGHLHIPLLADLTKQISRDYGVLLEGPGIALRGLFLIDPQGVVKHMSVNDLPVGRSVEETLRLVKAFQFVETHGEVCPASWTPESPTVSSIMNRSPSKSMWTILAPVTTLSKASSYHAGLP
uniref:Thioredoxin-dependent peroxide reductase, mitochondrial n=1 Tax=Gadus morhua TaxID=8049 RepID=A0A8C4Z7F2_GADMO